MILLDTCTYLYAAHEPNRLSPRARRILAARENQLVWSVVSTWELGIKARKGRLDFPGNALDHLDEGLRQLGVRVLPVEHAHVRFCIHLPEIHSDPFDRMLIAQAAVEGLTMLSSDQTIPRYEAVKVIW